MEQAEVRSNDGMPLLTRYSGNPILSRKDWPYPINSVLNAGVVLLADGDTLLLCRVEDRSGLSHLCAARSANGIDNWRIDPQPTLVANPQEYPEEIWGIEDPRITYVPELEQYAVAYTSFARGGPGVSLALTKDFRNFERFGVIMHPEDKDAALLPRRIGGRWALIHRPMTALGAHMWISYSPDLRHWGSHKIILEARRGGWWDANKIGLCSPPIETAKGWLVIYHGVRQTASGSIYRLGWHSSIWRSQTSACSAETLGYSVQKLPMNVAETSMTLCSPADRQSARTGTQSICIMARLTPALRLPRAASDVSSPGLTPTQVCQRGAHFNLVAGMDVKDCEHGEFKPELARLVTASTLHPAKVPSLQLSEI